MMDSAFAGMPSLSFLWLAWILGEQSVPSSIRASSAEPECTRSAEAAVFLMSQREPWSNSLGHISHAVYRKSGTDVVTPQKVFLHH
jgi:hypothetical protein